MYLSISNSCLSVSSSCLADSISLEHESYLPKGQILPEYKEQHTISSYGKGPRSPDPEALSSLRHLSPGPDQELKQGPHNLPPNESREEVARAPSGAPIDGRDLLFTHEPTISKCRVPDLAESSRLVSRGVSDQPDPFKTSHDHIENQSPSEHSTMQSRPHLFGSSDGSKFYRSKSAGPTPFTPNGRLLPLINKSPLRGIVVPLHLAERPKETRLPPTPKPGMRRMFSLPKNVDKAVEARNKHVEALGGALARHSTAGSRAMELTMLHLMQPLKSRRLFWDRKIKGVNIKRRIRESEHTIHMTDPSSHPSERKQAESQLLRWKRMKMGESWKNLFSHAHGQSAELSFWHESDQEAQHVNRALFDLSAIGVVPFGSSSKPGTSINKILEKSRKLP